MKTLTYEEWIAKFPAERNRVFDGCPVCDGSGMMDCACTLLEDVDDSDWVCRECGGTFEVRCDWCARFKYDSIRSRERALVQNIGVFMNNEQRRKMNK
jgi:hypothetical protein